MGTGGNGKQREAGEGSGMHLEATEGIQRKLQETSATETPGGNCRWATGVNGTTLLHISESGEPLTALKY